MLSQRPQPGGAPTDSPPNAILDSAGVPRTLAAPEAEVARQALIERLIALRDAAQVETVEEAEAIEPEQPED